MARLFLQIHSMKNHQPIPQNALALLGFVSLAVVIAWTLSGCTKEAPASLPPPTVEVVTVAQKDVPSYREAVGTLEGDVNATISAQVTGYLLNRGYTEGSKVTNGQVLFQIDKGPFEA